MLGTVRCATSNKRPHVQISRTFIRTDAASCDCSPNDMIDVDISQKLGSGRDDSTARLATRNRGHDAAVCYAATDAVRDGVLFGAGRSVLLCCHR